MYGSGFKYGLLCCLRLSGVKWTSYRKETRFIVCGSELEPDEWADRSDITNAHAQDGDVMSGSGSSNSGSPQGSGISKYTNGKKATGSKVPVPARQGQSQQGKANTSKTNWSLLVKKAAQNKGTSFILLWTIFSRNE